jgi:hypothetical protein
LDKCQHLPPPSPTPFPGSSPAPPRSAFLDGSAVPQRLLTLRVRTSSSSTPCGPPRQPLLERSLPPSGRSCCIFEDTAISSLFPTPPNHPSVAERILLQQRRSLFNNTSFQCTFDDLPFVASALPGTVDRHNHHHSSQLFSICFNQPKIPINEPPKLNDLELLLFSTSRSVHRLLPPLHLPTYLRLSASRLPHLPPQFLRRCTHLVNFSLWIPQKPAKQHHHSSST